jgi:hypothetical protein
MAKRQRLALCLGAQNGLSHRIAEYRPVAVVSLLIGIADIVAKPALAAGSQASLFRVPFPGNGWQNYFCDEMLKVIPGLPRESVAIESGQTWPAGDPLRLTRNLPEA